MKTQYILPLLLLFFYSILPLSGSTQTADSTNRVTNYILASTPADDLLTIEDPAPQLSSDGRIPLIMVHGWNFNGKPAPPGVGTWDSHLKYILNDPELSHYFKPYLVKYWSNSISVQELGSLLRDKLQAAGLVDKPFVILAHSMGGLVSRSFMTEQTFTEGAYTGRICGDMVKRIITLGTPHHGSPMANGPARDAKVNLLLKLYMSAIESFVFSDNKYNEVNRSDLRWDNYDNLLNYSKYSGERNDWLTNLNSHSEYDNKMICYASSVRGVFSLPPYNTTEEDFKVGAYVIDQSFNLPNDGIVPLKSASFEGHTPKRIRTFTEYNHTDIGCGKTTDTTLFTSIKEDLLEVVPPQIIWPTNTGVFLKYSTQAEIKWEAPSSVKSVNIYLSEDNGITFNKLADNIDASSGTFQWAVPDTNLNSCLIRITKASDESEFTQSGSPFTIYHNRLSFQNPLANGYLVPDKANQIEWVKTGVASKVNIYYYDAEHDIKQTIAESVPSDQPLNSYQWTPDPSLPPTDSAHLIIQLLMPDSIVDKEDYSFNSPSIMMLGTPSISILSPSDSTIDIDGYKGEKLEAGSTYTIRWKSEGEIKFFKVSLCDSAKRIIQLIRKKNSIPDTHVTSSTTWKVPEIYGNYFYLLINAGLNENSITTSAFSSIPFRINKQPKITSPEDTAGTISLTPCLSLAAINGATRYYFSISDKETNGVNSNKTYFSSTPEICIPNTFSDELLPGTSYKLTAWAVMDTTPSYISQTEFQTAKATPDSFLLVNPIKGDTLWNDEVNFSWNHAKGAAGYYFKITSGNKFIADKTLGRSDTTLTIGMDKNGYHNKLEWEVLARNDFGEIKSISSFFNKDRVGIDGAINQPQAFSLTCNPNPICNQGRIQFILPPLSASYNVTLSLCNITGQCIKTLIRKNMEPGIQQIILDSKNLPAEKGIYLLFLEVNGRKSAIKLSLN